MLEFPVVVKVEETAVNVEMSPAEVELVAVDE
jgi:hypothetical protein